MKNLVVLPLIAIVFISYTSKAQATNIAQSLCEYVQVDNKSKLRSFLKSNKLKIRNVFSGVSCNGKNLLAFASENNAVKTGSLMIGKLPKATVKTHLASISLAELAAIAEKRVSS
jgi:hypothetical protein